jgi:hypothetical protein
VYPNVSLQVGQADGWLVAQSFCTRTLRTFAVSSRVPRLFLPAQIWFPSWEQSFRRTTLQMFILTACYRARLRPTLQVTGCSS